LTFHYLLYGREAYGWHYGIWEGNGATNHVDSLIRSNELLLEDLHLNSDSLILDVGCGVGGLAIWAARKFGCRVIGITHTKEHVKLARRLAEQIKQSARCEFLATDLNAFSFKDGAFDVIVNQETYLHAQDKEHYMAEVNRLLKPGGAWRAIDFSIQEEPLNLDQKKSYDDMRTGWKITSLIPASHERRFMAQIGFASIRVSDITCLTLPTTRHIIRHCHIPLWLTKLRLDWLFFSQDLLLRRHHQGHFRTGLEYSRGLQEGYFRHNYYGGVKPLLN